MTKILFLIHDLGRGGAEKVLVDLVNNMDPGKFDITVIALFGGGVNERSLKPHIRFRAVFPKAIPGNSHLMKLLAPEQLHRLCIKERYDIEVAYLEGPSARVISGCSDPDTKLVCWIHSTLRSVQTASRSFRSVAEARGCYRKFHRIICVSKWTCNAFQELFPDAAEPEILYNTVESQHIIESAAKPVPEGCMSPDEIALITVGTLKPVKAYDRLIRIHRRLRGAGYPVHTYFLGTGPDLEALQRQAAGCGCADTVTFLGYDIEPYKYVAKSQLYVCCSLSEGFSTSVTEALIVGTPVCTVEVSGMKELLGQNGEWGVVTENDEEALYQGIKRLLDDPALLAHYRQRAAERGKMFSTEKTVKAVEEMLLSL